MFFCEKEVVWDLFFVESVCMCLEFIIFAVKNKKLCYDGKIGD